jgi:hypothetical protein
MKLTPDPDCCQVCNYWLCRIGQESLRAGVPGAYAALKRVRTELDGHLEHSHSDVPDLVNEENL